jgi:transcriptional regulator with GAF, ATPase, and Fis domain
MLSSADLSLVNNSSIETAPLESTWSTSGFIDSQSLQRKISMLQVILASAPEFNLSRCILLTGETGVGKTRLAQLLAQKARPNDPYVHVNCATLPPQLADSMIFGSVKGAFSDSVDKPGYIEAAGRGILFLDEVGELPLETQAHLLTVLESKSHRRFGQTAGKEYLIECKFIFGTNKDLWTEVQLGRFRKDLFYRIATYGLEIPPLRKRMESPIVNLFLDSLIENLCKEHGGITLTNNAKKSFMQFAKEYHWPGNIREFKHFIQTVAANTLLSKTEKIVSCFLMNRIIADKISASSVVTAELPVELKIKIKQRWPKYAHGEIEEIFRVAVTNRSAADAGKVFFAGGKKVVNYSDAFKKHIRRFGLKWDKNSSTNLSEM